MAKKKKSRHSAGFIWVEAPEDVLIPAIKKYGDRLLYAVYAVGQYMALKIANYARQRAIWIDRTGNARHALHAIVVFGKTGEIKQFNGTVAPEVEHVVDVAKNLVAIFLSHGMDYGKYLETIAAGKYAIVMPALQAHYNEIMAEIQKVLRA